MRLLIDVGNTAVKVGIQQQGKITRIDEVDIPWQHIEEIVVAQVGSSNLLRAIELKAQQHGIELRHACVSPELGAIKCAYKQYQNLGIDRWLTVIAAHYLYDSKDCVIIDSGTATKVDVVTRAGGHLGGWILPGLDMMIASLLANTEKVFSDDVSVFEQSLGLNTPNAVKNGALVATLGAVYSGIARLPCDFSQVQVIFAGGYGELLQQHFDKPSVFVDDLVLRGLNYWSDFVR
ncbi:MULTISPECIES: type III pantothenate kinase [unclassified Pseudoalteromonas]|uniref:type III pantothenate kinase n=1 Tax=unclassified Pseudoalteromonas TaxID=194690 RepID=UPI001B3A72AF|nr:type III pantothenate kinase [Pseudoalteromonas sp. MMG012]MBQ4844818.1 type III pantothenate kinase [Pseudoalteromonas sp. MMG005]MBQ4851228.1 type III pantothenate kinase [Pseudoalteromonas sp. MMG012]